MYLGLHKKLTIVMVSMMLLIFCVVGAITYYVCGKAFLNIYGEQAIDSASYIANQLDGDLLYSYAMNNRKDEKYSKIKDRLVAYKENLSMTDYLYVFVPKSENEIIYLYDIYTQEEYDYDSVSEEFFGFKEEFDDTFKAAKIIYTTNATYKHTDIANTKNGKMLRAYAPVFGQDGLVKAIVGIDVDLLRINEGTWNLLRYMSMAIVVMSFAAIVFLINYVSSKIINPIKKIEHNCKAFSISSHVDSWKEYETEISGNDEIAQLAETMNVLMENTQQYIDSIRDISYKNEVISAEIEFAEKIQSSIIPRLLPNLQDETGFELDAFNISGREMGADLYDFFMLDDSHLALIIAKPSAKGVAAALFMVAVKALLKNHLQHGYDVNDALDITNNQLCSGNEAAIFVSLWAGVLDVNTGILQFSNASHENPVVVTNGAINEIESKKRFIPLAAWEDTPYEMDLRKVAEGSVIILYNSGVLSAKNPAGEEYGYDRFTDSIKRHYKKRVSQICLEIKRDIMNFVGNASQDDDYTVVVVKIK